MPTSKKAHRKKRGRRHVKHQVLPDQLNLRQTASVKSRVVSTLRKGDVVSVLDDSPNGAWKKIQTAKLSGWASASHLAAQAAAAPRPYDPILQQAATSAIATYPWVGQGVAPIGYTKGLAVVYAKVYCKWKAGAPAALEMARADKGDPQRDALSWYADIFASVGMNNEASGSDTLRHVFDLLMGIGMLESSGEYFCGRYGQQDNVSDDTAEAGLFQTSYNLSRSSPLLPPLYQSYAANPFGFLGIFKEGVPAPDAKNLKNWGNGPGVAWQKLTKACPAFAAEFAAVGLRNDRGLWSTVNKKQAEVRPECDLLLVQVQHLVDSLNLSVADFVA